MPRSSDRAKPHLHAVMGLASRGIRIGGHGTRSTLMAIDEAKLNEFMGKFVNDLGATMNAAMVVIGDKLGLYKAMAGAGPLSSKELALKTETSERYVREWLNSQAAGGYVTYDAKSKKYTLPEEQALAL